MAGLRYQRARLAIAAGLAAGVVTGTAYFAGNARPAIGADASDSSTSTTAEAPKTAAQKTTTKRSKGS